MAEHRLGRFAEENAPGRTLIADQLDELIWRNHGLLHPVRVGGRPASGPALDGARGEGS